MAPPKRRRNGDDDNGNGNGRYLPDPSVFTVMDAVQAATFDVPTKRDGDGDIKDNDGTKDVYFSKLRIGQKVVEEICIKELNALSTQDSSVDSTTFGYRQFALNFPYCQTTLEYYKRAIKIGKKDATLVMPKIHRVETFMLPNESELLVTTPAGTKGADDEQLIRHNVYNNAIYAWASDKDIRPFQRGEKKFNKAGARDWANSETQALPKADEELQSVWEAEDMPSFRHYFRPLYVKNYPFNVDTASNEMYQPNVGINPKAKQDQYKEILRHYHVTPAFADLGKDLPYWNEKKLPLQLWEPRLYLGVASRCRIRSEIVFKVEYSYEIIDGQDYWFKENGFVDEKYITDIFSEEPSRMFVATTRFEGAKYVSALNVKTQRLAIESTVLNKDKNCSDDENSAVTEAPSIDVGSNQCTKAKFHIQAKTDDGTCAFNPLNPFAKS